MKTKLERIKDRDAARELRPTVPLEIVVDQKAQVEAMGRVEAAVQELAVTINGQEPVDFTQLAEQLEVLHKTLDFTEQFKALREAVEASKVETVKVKEFNELIEAVKENKPLPVEIDLSAFEKAIIEVNQRVQDNTASNQAPSDYQPVRRVVKVGKNLIFDDHLGTGAAGGGGGLSDLKNNGTIYKAVVSLSTTGTIVGGVAAKKIRLLSAVLVAGGTVNVKWQSDSTDLSGAMPLVANSGFVLPATSPAQGEYLETDLGADLKLNLSGSVQVSGHISYYLE